MVLPNYKEAVFCAKIIIWTKRRYIPTEKVFDLQIDVSINQPKIYECLGQEYDCYIVIDESDEDYLYPINEFEIMEEIND